MRSNKSSKRSSPDSVSSRRKNAKSAPAKVLNAVPRNQNSPPFPKAPALDPVSPQNVSTISSLAGSQELGRPLIEPPAPLPDSGKAETTSGEIGAHSETQALMQMLGMVGSTFLEADKEDCNGSDEAEDEQESCRQAATGDKEVSDRLNSLMQENCSDDASTPKGRGKPMSSSVLNSNPQKLSKSARKQSTSSKDIKVQASNKLGKDELIADDDVALDKPEIGMQAKSEVVSKKNNCTSSSRSSADLTTMQLQPCSGDRIAGGQGDMLKDFDRLTAQLRETFLLDEKESLVLTQPCWLFRSLLLQGQLYLTTGHLCFYAYLPSRESKSLKTGSIGKKTRRTHRFSQHWASLRGGVLSWYHSSKDPYFPQGHIDLRKVSAIEPSIKHDERFKILTPERRFTFLTENKQARDSWIAVLRKETFRAQNEGESVRISLPLEVILDIESTLTVDSTKMVSITVVDEAADFSADEYFFLHLSNQDAFIKAAKELLTDVNRSSTSSVKRDPTLGFSKLSIQDSTGAVQVLPMVPASLDSVPIVRATLPTEEPTLEHSHSHEGDSLKDQSYTTEDNLSHRLSSESFDTYPPPPSSAYPPKSFEQNQKEIERGWAVPGWIKAAPSKVLGRGAAAEAIASFVGSTDTRRVRTRRKIMESWPRNADTDSVNNEDAHESDEDPMGQSALSTFSLLDTPEESEFATGGATFAEQLRQTFGLGDSEQLMGHMHAYLYRVLPIAGRFFVSTEHLAFRSSGIAAKTVGRTLMLAPLQDIVSASKHQALRPGQHGIVITIRGHEELFVEVSSLQKRDELLSLIEGQAESKRENHMSKDPDLVRERSTAFVLRDLSDKLEEGHDPAMAELSLLNRRGPDHDQHGDMSNLEKSLHAEGPLRFTLLTVGSRGDVQPYIALAKGLQADGHYVKIATHAEFGKWIVGHGVEFSEIGGDPAELMRICVENGTFTVAFLREGMSKFRGWLDDLLESAWRACQGCDVIIECPSAIAGIHVAEALQVPYYRAFTMPWTRTRAYPHAFAVPKAKAGGNYNYMSYVIFDQMFWRASASQINRWRKNTLNLQPTNLDKLEQHKVPFIYNFSPSLVPRPLDWFEWIRVTGFWFLENPENSASSKWEAPKELTQFIQRARKNNRKLVYIGWGSIVVSDAEAVTRCVLQAVQKSGVCAILSKGWSDRLTAGSRRSSVIRAVDPAVLEDVFEVTSVPHDWLFPQIDAACHHGGAGTLGASLRAGLPTVVKPYFGDQFFWGQQVESLGVGSCVRHLTADNLATALVTATTNKKQIERAKKLGKQILAEDGIGNAVKAIYRDLDYARSRIKRNSRLPPEPTLSASSNTEQSDATELLSTTNTADTVGSDSLASDDWTDVGSRLQDL